MLGFGKVACELCQSRVPKRQARMLKEPASAAPVTLGGIMPVGSASNVVIPCAGCKPRASSSPVGESATPIAVAHASCSRDQLGASWIDRVGGIP